MQNHWRRVSRVICDRVKENIHKMVVRPAILYGLETVALTKKSEAELEVN